MLHVSLRFSPITISPPVSYRHSNWAIYPWQADKNDGAHGTSCLLLIIIHLHCLQHVARWTSSPSAMQINEHLTCQRLKCWQNAVNGVLINAPSNAERGQQAELIKCSLQCDQSQPSISFTCGLSATATKPPLSRCPQLPSLSTSPSLYLTHSAWSQLTSELTSCRCRSLAHQFLHFNDIWTAMRPPTSTSPKTEPSTHSTHRARYRTPWLRWPWSWPKSSYVSYMRSQHKCQIRFSIKWGKYGNSYGIL